MKVVIQRVKNAAVSVDGAVKGKIGKGLLVYLGVAVNDTEKDAAWIADKTANLRIFSDDQGKMNLSIKDIIAAGLQAGILAVSQFTLLGDCVKGRRPYYGDAADPQIAKPLYDLFMEKIRGNGIVCEAGIFQAHMEVDSVNDGPV
ncbi:MAG: D-aminoacyl-tRNA deacylase, partial [Treponema sp.]|nr:D-aminoacyl-tRNA deacylase [Treponema sp.]